MTKTAFLFPGQGSQTVGMGEDLFPLFPEKVAEADAILGYSITELCLNDPQEQLNLTQYTQPALYVVSCLAYLEKQQQESPKPDFLAGHSLGEYSALFAGGAFNFGTGLKLVKRRGELMAEAPTGGMAAVIGLEAEAVRTVLATEGSTDVSVANDNSPDQIVVSGDLKTIQSLGPTFQEAGAKRYIPLNVSGAFHSPFMAEAAKAYAAFLNEFAFSPLHTPVISNVFAEPYPADVSPVDALSQQLTAPVRWTETITMLAKAGVSNYEELGPGSVLSRLVRRILKSVSA